MHFIYHDLKKILIVYSNVGNAFKTNMLTGFIINIEAVKITQAPSSSPVYYKEEL